MSNEKIDDGGSAKPQPTIRAFIDYHKAASFIEAKLGYPLRDTLGLFGKNGKGHFVEWCERHGEKAEANNQNQFARYKDAPDGECAAPEYRDYWHFLCDNCCNLKNGGIITIGSYLLEFGQPWQNEITQTFINEFGDNCEYRVEW